MRTAGSCRALITTVALALAAPATVGAQRGERAERYTLSGRAVVIYDLAGEVHLVRGSGPDVVVTLTRIGRDANDLDVETGPLQGRSSLRVIFPADEILYPGTGARWRSRSTLSVGDDGTFGRGRSGRRVVVSTDEGSFEARADLEVAVPPGSTVELHVGVGVASVSNVSGDVRLDAVSAPVTATGTRGTLDVRTASGGVEVRDAEGRLRVETASGSIEVSDSRAELDLRSASGSVRLSDVAAGRVAVDVASGAVSGFGIEAPTVQVSDASGNVRLSGLRSEEVRVSVASGSADVTLSEDVRLAEISSASGNVTLRVPPAVGAELDMESHGGIDLDVPMTVVERSRSRVIGRVGDGRARVTLRAASGRVRVARGL